MTWADIAQQPAQAQAAAVWNASLEAGGTTAVLDASAIIAGFSRTVAKHLITIPEVIDECKDAVAKQRLQLLPEGIRVQQPSAESIRRVAAFARTVGELQTISCVDRHLLALTHTLEVATHGQDHLRLTPVPPRAAARPRGRQGQLPGWGSQGGDWTQLDALNDAEAPLDTEREVSKISGRVQQLDLEGSHKDIESAGDPVEPATANSDESSDGEGGASGHEGGWDVAAKSSNAARRHRRRERRAAARALAAEAEAGNPQFSTDALPSNSMHNHQSSNCDQEEASGSDSGDEQSEHDHTQDSCVALVTGDYAMQNVCLQMGMKLVAPDGARVTRVARWALRCAACFKVTLEHGRLFCGQCGNAALNKVEVVVGSNGMLQYGVRRKHNLRGTRYSLPKPKGGKTAQPLLREDVLLQKMHHTKPKHSELPDAFAPEYGQETWFNKPGSGARRQQCDQVTAAASLGAGKRNPNERRMIRSNRRK